MSFKKTSNILLMLVLTFFVSACSNKVEDLNGAEDSVSFNYDSIQAIDIQTTSMHSEWPDLKNRVLVNLKSCLIDTTYLEKVAGEKFSIESNISSNSKRTNGAGCIYWSEELEFNYLNQESYYQISGTIRGLDSHSGSRAYKLAVNPWKKKLIDLRDNSVFKVSAIKEELEAQDRDSFITTENYSISIVDKKFHQNETRLKMEISTTPQIVRKNLYGGIVKENLSGGEFNAKYYLLSKDANSEERVILGEAEREDIRISEEGILKTSVTFNLRKGAAFNSDSIIELGVKVSPIGHVMGNSVSEGVLPLKKLDGTFSVKLLDTSLPLETMASFGHEKTTTIESSEENFGFVIDTMVIKKGSESGSNYSGSSERSVDAIFDVKIVDSLIRQPISNQAFNVQILHKGTNKSVFSSVVKTKSGSGNLNFRANINFKSYEKRYWKEYIIKLSGVRNPYKAISKERVVYINPWVKDDFAIDSKEGAPPTSTSDNTPQIYIKDFKFNFVGNVESSFKLNKNLDLAFTRTMRIEANPQTRLSHSYSGPNSGYERLLNGKYKLRFLILVPKDTFKADHTKIVDLKEYYTLTGDEKVVTVEDGYMNAKVDLPLLFNDLMFLSLRNIALVELSSLEEGVDLAPGYFVGSMVGTAKTGSVVASDSKKLSTGNLNIAKTLISKLKTIKYKLERDETIGNNMKRFISRLQGAKRALVPTFDFSSYKQRWLGSRLEVFEEPKSFLRKYAYGYRSERDLEKEIHAGKLGRNTQKIVCNFLYDMNAKTQESRKNNIYEDGYYGGEGTPLRKGALRMKGIWFDKCHKNFSQFVEFRKYHHVHRVSEQPTNISSETRKLTRANATFVSAGEQFSKMEGVRETDYYSHGLEAEMGLKTPGKFVSAGVGLHKSYGHRVDIYTTNNKSSIVSDQNRIVNDDSAVFPYTRFDMTYSARVRTCLLITPKIVTMRPIGGNPGEHAPLRKLFVTPKTRKPMKVSSPKRLYLCAASAETLKKSDSWYFIKLLAGSNLADGHLAKNTVMNFVRGEINFKIFREEHIDTDRELIIRRSYDKDVRDNTREYLEGRGKGLSLEKRVGIGFPGLIR